MRFAFVDDHKAEFPVEVLCAVLKVARSGYYAWTRRSAWSTATAGTASPWPRTS